MILTIDVGGTKTLLAVFNAQGQILERTKFPTSKDYKQFILDLNFAIKSLSHKNFIACACAVPGMLDRKNGIALSFGNLEWKNIPIKRDIEKIVGCICYIENDAKAAGLAESHAHGFKNKRILYMTISTGIGLGLTVNGAIDYSVHDLGGSAMLLEHKGLMVPWEEYASGKAIFKRYGKLASEINDPKIWEDIVSLWLVGFIELITLVSPDLIVIGGGVGNNFEKFGHILIRQLKRSGKIQIPEIVQAKHPDLAVIYGCFYLVKQMQKKLT